MTLKLEVGKYYRTRDGRKVGPMRAMYDNFMSCNGTEVVWNRHDGRVNSYTKTNSDLVEEWKGEPMDNNESHTAWKDLTDIEKGELLLAHHEGKVIERDLTSPFKELEPVWEEDVYPDWNPEDIYRIKPEAVVDVKEIWLDTDGEGGICYFCTYHKLSTHKITFQLIDGKPDCNSIKMEEL